MKVTPEQTKQYGVLLPHFGSHARRDRLIESARAIERYGFDSVWVRDHLIFHPHEHEDQDRTHVDPFVVLSAVAAVTERLILGTATLIPHRHPILAALMLGSLDFIAGPGRVLAGWGIGAYDHEFEAIGMSGPDRRALVAEQIAIMRELWTGRSVDHAGPFYSFKGVEVHPVPGPDRTIPIWYGGNSPASVRRTVEYCDGWMPARMPRRDFTKRMRRMRRFAEEAGKPMPHSGTIPYVVPARTVEEGLSALNLPALLEDSARLHEAPPSGAFRSFEDLDGAAIVGPADVIVEEVRRFQEAGALHFVFDMRSRFEDWEECLAFIGEQVLPQLRRGDGRPRPDGAQAMGTRGT